MSGKRRNIVYETDFVRSNSELKRIIFTYTYISDKIILLYTEDITERKQAERNLIESEEKFRSLITEMDQGLALHEAIYDEREI